MTGRIVLALSASSVALLPNAGLAQASMSYEAGQYEYAQPVPEADSEVVTETVTETVVVESAPVEPAPPVFFSKPTIQPIDPSNPAHYAPAVPASEPLPAARVIPARASGAGAPEPQPTYVYVRQPPQIVYVHQAPGAYAYAPAGASRVIYRDGVAPTAPGPGPHGYAQSYGYAPASLPAGAHLVAFDRDAWLEQCRSRLDTYESDSDRGKIIGALVGGLAGGVLGNRIAGRGNRTAGSLVGAGAGALLGAAAGDAIDDGNRSRTDSYGQCTAYLDDYMANAMASAGTTQYSQPGQYMLVPVTVAVPQRAVYREGAPEY